MSLTVNQLIDHVTIAQKSQPIKSDATAEEVEGAFDAFNGVFGLNTAIPEDAEDLQSVLLSISEPEVETDASDAVSVPIRVRGLVANPAIELSDSRKRVVNELSAAFNRTVQSGEVTYAKAPEHSLIPSLRSVPERSGATDTVISTEAESTTIAPAAGGCTWRWWLKTRWWGFRLSLNHCAVQWVTNGAAGLAAALAAFGLPAVVGAVIGLAAGVLKFFDKGKGVRIYFLWTGQFWVTSKPK